MALSHQKALRGKRVPEEQVPEEPSENPEASKVEKPEASKVEGEGEGEGEPTKPYYFVAETRWRGGNRKSFEEVRLTEKEAEDLKGLVEPGEPYDLVPDPERLESGRYRVREGAGGLRITQRDVPSKIYTHPDVLFLNKQQAVELIDVVEPLDQDAFVKVLKAQRK